MRRPALSILLCFFICSAYAQRPIDTFHLYFDLGVAQMSKSMEKKIDLLIYNAKILNGSSINLIGYTDFLGSEGFNKNLSIQRAKNVKDYLVKYGINERDIKTCVGKGEIRSRDTSDQEGHPEDRKVDLVVNNILISSERVFKPGIAANSKNGTKSANNKSTATSKTTANTNDTGRRKAPDIKDLAKLKEGQTLTLKNVYFPPGSHVIKPESYETIEKLFRILADNPALKISIEGHVCCIHDVPDALDIDTNELLLSVNRAKEIYSYLVKNGIEEDRLKYSGFGRSRPIVDVERSEEDADRNRRVEIRVVSVH